MSLSQALNGAMAAPTQTQAQPSTSPAAQPSRNLRKRKHVDYREAEDEETPDVEEAVKVSARSTFRRLVEQWL